MTSATTGGSGETWATVSYVPTVEDTIAAYRYRAKSSKQVVDAVGRQRRTMIIIVVVLVAAVSFLIMLSDLPGAEWLHMYVQYGVPGAMFTAILILTINMLAVRGRLGAKGGTAQIWERQIRSGVIETDTRPTTMTIGNDGLHVDRGTLRGWFSWETIQRVEEFEQRLFVFVSRDQFLLIPIAAFASADDARIFRGMIESSMRRAPDARMAPPTIAARS